MYPGCQPRLLLCIIRQTEAVASTAPAPQDMASVVAVAGQYVTVEKYIEAKNLLHIFKLGDFYRAMMLVVLHCRVHEMLSAGKLKHLLPVFDSHLTINFFGTGTLLNKLSKVVWTTCFCVPAAATAATAGDRA